MWRGIGSSSREYKNRADRCALWLVHMGICSARMNQERNEWIAAAARTATEVEERAHGSVGLDE